MAHRDLFQWIEDVAVASSSAVAAIAKDLVYVLTPLVVLDGVIIRALDTGNPFFGWCALIFLSVHIIRMGRWLFLSPSGQPVK